MDLFTLTNERPTAKPERFEQPQCRQSVLFAGLECLPGQQDLFPTDGDDDYANDTKTQARS